jgi:DNA primase
MDNISIDLVEEYIRNNSDIKIRESGNHKILVDCPYCDSINKYKGILNITEEYLCYHCYRCGVTKSIFGYFKDIGTLQHFYNYINITGNISKYDIISNVNKLLHNQIKHIDINTKKIGFQKYIEDNGLLPINKMYYAYQYAKERTNGDEEEISKYYADDKYIYIPIYNNYEIVSFIARRYIDLDNIPRYKKAPVNSIYNFKEPSKVFCFLDEYLDDFSDNTIYIAEGYFDAYSINKSFKKYLSLALLGKTFSMKSLEELCKYTVPTTNIVLCLDSPHKDINILKDIISNGQKIINNFINLNIVVMDESDPNEIYIEKGSKYLRDILIYNQVSFMSYYMNYILKGD